LPRAYDSTRRTAEAARTAERILDVTESIYGRGEMTLQAIADGAGVTVQTVLRHFGSRQGCLDAVRERFMARVDAQRGHTAPGDVDGALTALLTHYEAEGRLVLALLAHEVDDPMAQEAVNTGRDYHRAWVVRCFGPHLEPSDAVQVDAVVAATDLYVWKLLRLDLGRSPDDVRAVLDRLVRAALEAP